MLSPKSPSTKLPVIAKIAKNGQYGVMGKNPTSTPWPSNFGYNGIKKAKGYAPYRKQYMSVTIKGEHIKFYLDKTSSLHGTLFIKKYGKLDITLTGIYELENTYHYNTSFENPNKAIKNALEEIKKMKEITIP